MTLSDSIAQLGALVDDARTLVADLQEAGPYMPTIGHDMAIVRTYLNWCAARINTIEQRRDA